MGAVKNYILDTNVLLHDPASIFAFEDNRVVIPLCVIGEIDTFKREQNEIGRAARTVSRSLDSLRHRGSLTDGVSLDSGGVLQVAFSEEHLPQKVQDGHPVDNRILAVALQFKEGQPNTPAVIITKDVNLRIRADALGLRAEDYSHDRVEIDELYSGWVDYEVTGSEVDAFYSQGSLPLPDRFLAPNTYVHLRDMGNPSHTALGKMQQPEKRILPLTRRKDGVWGIRAKNKEQTFAFDMLMNDNIRLVTLVGKAGTGKTLLALAAGLHKVTEETAFQRLLVSRPIAPLGRDLGYLPGDIEEKVLPWMQPIIDNVEFLMGLTTEKRDTRPKRSYRELIDLGIMQIEPLTYIRGRSIPSQFMIVDEAQNLTPHEVKTIITRAGEGTKIVLTGDPYQIDNPYVDATNNGLVHVVNRFKEQGIAGHITLTQGERSELADLATRLL